MGWICNGETLLALEFHCREHCTLCRCIIMEFILNLQISVAGSLGYEEVEDSHLFLS
jgi:hypothetical protein